MATLTTRSARCGRLIRWVVAVSMAGFVGIVGVGSAEAVPVPVGCDTEPDDIAAVQEAVDAASNDDVIVLSGTCDFSAAPPHGGTVSSIEATAVLVRPGTTPVTGLTITSAEGQMATIQGSGTQTAFAIAPGNDGVTITGLRFEKLARPVVVIGAAGATIGANRIAGDVTMDSAILAVADDESMTAAYGAAPPEGSSPTTATLTGATLSGLTVEGNTITYTPPGPGGDAGVSDVVAIDVRQAKGGLVDGVTIRNNAVGMFTADLATFRHNAVRVEGLAAVPASDPPALADYRIQDVTITGNNLGRFEDLDSDVAGVDAGDIHAGGRAAVVLIRVADFDVSANQARARLSATGTDGTPGGGIVTSDSSFGAIHDNDTIVVIADPTVPESADLGGIGVVQGIPGSSGDQGATDVEVAGNEIGVAGTGIGARRGIVLSGVDDVTVWGNDVHTSEAGLYVGADVQGPGGNALPLTVSRSVLCGNTLDGTTDHPDEVSFTDGSPPSTGNAFPGGAELNMSCDPTVSVDPAPPDPVEQGGTLTVSGFAWAGRPVDVTVSDEDGTAVNATGSTLDSGFYSFTFNDTAGELAELDDGQLDVTVTTSDPTGPAPPSVPRPTPRTAETTAILNLVDDPPGTATIDDGGDGFTNAEEVAGQATTGIWTASSDPVVKTRVWWSDDAGNIPGGCGPFSVGSSGSRRLALTCGKALPEGPFRFNVQWEMSTGTFETDSATSIKDTKAEPPTITSPTDGATVNTADVPISGASEQDATVHVTEEQPDGSFEVIATTTADTDGVWSLTSPFEDGTHRVTAYIVDPASNRSASGTPIDFTVDTSVPDTTAPDPPVITDPLAGSLLPGRFTASGTAEPGSTVRVFSNGVLVAKGLTKETGSWSAVVRVGTGSHTLEADATDAAGNTSTLSGSVTVTVDATKPGITVTAPAEDGEENVFGPGEPVVITGTATDNVAVSEVKVRFFTVPRQARPERLEIASCSGCPGSPVSWQLVVDNLLPGVYDVASTAVDSVGNPFTEVRRIFKLG